MSRDNLFNMVDSILTNQAPIAQQISNNRSITKDNICSSHTLDYIATTDIYDVNSFHPYCYWNSYRYHFDNRYY